MRYGLSILLAFVCVMVGACAHLGAGLEPPKVRVDSLRILEARGLSQRFMVGLRVINPNDRALPVKGLSYTLALNGIDLIEGVTGKVPTLEPFSETLVEVEASTDLVAALRRLDRPTLPDRGAAAARRARRRDHRLRVRLDPPALRERGDDRRDAPDPDPAGGRGRCQGAPEAVQEARDRRPPRVPV